MSETLVCKTNISAAGRRRRRVVGYVSMALCGVLLLSFMTSGTPALLRLSLFFPGLMSAIGLLQVRRGTCVALVAAGKKESEQGGLVAAPADEVAASRRVANTIYRDGLLIGLAAALAGYLSAFIAS